MKHLFIIIAALNMLVSAGCKSQKINSSSKFPDFYLEGHRGARGLAPENTIVSMIKAVDAGANVLEVDVYTSKDDIVIVTHDPQINISHTLTADGKELTKEEAAKYIFHQMTYEEIKTFDVGSKANRDYPEQIPVKAAIPTLSDLIDSVEAYTKARKLPRVMYNIELKTAVQNDGVYNATPKELTDAVMKVVNSKNIGKRFYLQSFDIRTVQYIHTNYPKVMVAFLDGNKGSFESRLAALGFSPDIYSPAFPFVTPELVKEVQQKKIKLIPWTVNDSEKMKSLLAWGVDGIITDYPDRLKALRK